MALHAIRRPSQDLELGTWQPQPDLDPCGEIRQGKKRKGSTLAVLRNHPKLRPQVELRKGIDHRASPQRVKWELKSFIRYRNAVLCSRGIRVTARIGLNEPEEPPFPAKF